MEQMDSPLWPIHLKPRANELLSSWMIRLAHSHGYKVERMCRILFGRDHALWSRDVDRLAPSGVLAKLCEVTGAKPERANLTTLASYAGFLSEQVPPGGHSSWIVSLHISHRQRIAPGLMYCSRCLQHNDSAYFRRTWRLAFVTVCTEHGIVLHDTCWQCKSPVMPHRVDIGKRGATPRDRSFVRCWKCGCKLSHGDAKPCDEYLLAFTRSLEAVAESGFANLVNHLGLHSVSYFSGIRILARLAAKKIGLSTVSIEKLPVGERLAAMRQVAEWHESWPTNFLQAMRLGRTTYSEIVQPREILPFWLEDIARPLKRHQHPTRNANEIAAAARLVENDQGRVHMSVLRLRFGVNIRRDRLPLQYRNVVSHDNHEALMASLEHSVARSFDTKIRFAFLQDQIMFTLFRFSDLSAAKICALSLTDMPTLQVSPSTKGDWWGAPSNRVESIRALHRHVDGTRCQFACMGKGESTFFSPFTGRPLSASGMQARFKNAVVMAALTAPIPNMAAYKISWL